MFLREENSSLRQKCTEIEEAHANLRARCFALDALQHSTTATSHHHHRHNYHQRRVSTAGSTTRTCTNRRDVKENQDLITSLYRRNEEIMRDYSILRNKHQNVLGRNDKLKKEVQSLHLRASGNYRPRTSVFPTSSSFARTGASMRLAKDANEYCSSNKRQAPHNYGADETDSLSEALASTNTGTGRSVPSDPPIFATKDPTGIAFPHQASSCLDYTYPSHDESLVKELANATSKLHSLKEKYGKLESTCNECLDKLEQTKRDLKVTRRANELLEDEVTELRAQNASLEEKVTQLCCDAPIASIRLPVAMPPPPPPPASSSITASSSPTTSAAGLRSKDQSPKCDSDNSENDDSDKNMDGRTSEPPNNNSADSRVSPEEGNEDDERAAKVEALESPPTSIVAADMASSKVEEGVTTETEIDDDVTTSLITSSNAASTKANKEVDAQSQSSYHDETFDEYEDESFED